MDVLLKSGLAFFFSTFLLGFLGCPAQQQEPVVTPPVTQNVEETPVEQYQNILDFEEFVPDSSEINSSTNSESVNSASWNSETQPVSSDDSRTSSATTSSLGTTTPLTPSVETKSEPTVEVNSEPTVEVNSEPTVLTLSKDTVDTVDKTAYLDQGGMIWDVLYVGNQSDRANPSGNSNQSGSSVQLAGQTINPVGFQQTIFSRETLQDQPVLCVQVHSQLNVPLQQERIGSEFAVRSYETLSGELIGCQAKTVLDQVLTEHLVKVVNNRLERTVILADNPAQVDTISYKSGTNLGGFRAIQISLWKNPIEEREERRVSFYDPVNQTLVESVLTAKGIEQMTLLDKPWSLRRIEAVLTYHQQQSPFTFWTDALGNIVCSKLYFPDGQYLIAIRTVEETAKMYQRYSSGSQRWYNAHRTLLSRRLPVPKIAQGIFLTPSNNSIEDVFPCSLQVGCPQNTTEIQLHSGKPFVPAPQNQVQPNGETVGSKDKCPDRFRNQKNGRQGPTEPFQAFHHDVRLSNNSDIDPHSVEKG